MLKKKGLIFILFVFVFFNLLYGCTGTKPEATQTAAAETAAPTEAQPIAAEKDPNEIVITSYSIHYTKLYDPGTSARPIPRCLCP